MNRWALAVGMAFVACAWPGTPAAAAGNFVAATPYATATQPATLLLDATQASRGIMFAHEKIPVVPGPFTLVYPKWIPGEHGPTGPLNDLAAIAHHGERNAARLAARHHRSVRVSRQRPGGRARTRRRFRRAAERGPSDTMSTHSIAIVNWNRVLLYQEGINSRQYFFKPSIAAARRMGVRQRSARSRSTPGNRVDFATTSLEMLVDSPLDMGRFVKKWTLWKDGATFVAFDVFADAPQDLDISEDLLERVQARSGRSVCDVRFAPLPRLHRAADAQRRSRLSRHRTSPVERRPRRFRRFLTDPDESLSGGDLVTHEFSHSWNGKYRRPDDLTTPNFQVPMQTDLLWVYEGMNQYLGDLLSFRAGIRESKLYPEYLATVYSEMDAEDRPLDDAADRSHRRRAVLLPGRAASITRSVAARATSTPKASSCGSTSTRSFANARTARARSTRSCTSSPNRRPPVRWS